MKETTRDKLSAGLSLGFGILRDISRAGRLGKTERVVLFGSRARGTNWERSDIDLAVSGGSFETFCACLQDESCSPYPFDLVSADSHLSVAFAAQIRRDGVLLYEKERYALEKLSNFLNALAVLASARFDKSYADPIYRIGIIGQFQLTFETAWKALQEQMRAAGIAAAGSGSPRDIIRTAHQTGFLESNVQVWFAMLTRRNTVVQVHNQEIADEAILAIETKYLHAFQDLAKTLRQKASEAAHDKLL